MEDQSIPKRAGSAADSESVATQEEDNLQSTPESPIQPSTPTVEEPTTPIREEGDSVPSPSHPHRLPNQDRQLQPLPAPPVRPGFNRVNTDVALNSAMEGLVLYDLTDKVSGKALFSPHTIKTILDLKLLNIGYDRQRLSFVEIRTELASKVAENVTVPTLELGDGSHLSDSWAIAEYLERKHPEGHKIFGSTASKRLAAMLNDFGKTVLGPHLGPLAMPGVEAILDKESAAYFRDVKIGSTRWSKITNLSASEKENHISQAASKLHVIEAMLNSESGGPNDAVIHGATSNVKRNRSIWLAGGEEPSHADFVLFGWYVYTRAAGPTTTKEIWSCHTSVKRWVQALVEWCGPIADDFI